MQCPKCEAEMEQIVYHEVEVDRCSSCKGIWFDAGELDALRATDAASVLDSGDPGAGARMSETDRYACPRCSGGMVRMVDPRQSHIWYEKCIACGGSFFDAGEFRDLTEHGIADFFRSLLREERR